MVEGRQDFGKLAENVIDAAPCMLEMPAGTGKTHLLVTIAGKLAERGVSVLVLTHTNAGVSAIRSRCLRLGINPAQLSISTISSWAERAALAYCETSGHNPASDRWQQGYYHQCVSETLALLGHDWFANIAGASYQALLVDEYQDCSLVQHLLVKRLSGLVPCTICFGDPMQRIFDFAGEEFPDWDADVREFFPVFDGVQPYPYRWVDHSIELGEWLTYGLREQLSRPTGRLTIPSDVMGLQYVDGLSKNPRELSSAAYALSSFAGDSLVICPSMPPAQSLNDAKKLARHYRYVEEIEGKFIKKRIDAFVRAKQDGNLTKWLVAFIKLCSTDAAKALDATYCSALARGDSVDNYLTAKNRQEYARLLSEIGAFNQQPSALALVGVDRALKLSKARLYRREAWDNVIRTILEVEQTGEDYVTVLEALRSKTKYTNDRFRGNVVSRTLLVKGLEFSNVLVTHASKEGAYSKQNLYVALTRATDILWIQR